MQLKLSGVSYIGSISITISHVVAPIVPLRMQDHIVPPSAWQQG